MYSRHCEHFSAKIPVFHGGLIYKCHLVTLRICYT